MLREIKDNFCGVLEAIQKNNKMRILARKIQKPKQSIPLMYLAKDYTQL